MKVIIAGSRTITDASLVQRAVVESKFGITSVVSGGAAGVDKLGEEWARKNCRACLCFEADWDKHGNAAGPLRNEEMARNADALIAVWDGESRGTKDMIDRAYWHQLLVYVHRVEAQP